MFTRSRCGGSQTAGDVFGRRVHSPEQFISVDAEPHGRNRLDECGPGVCASVDSDERQSGDRRPGGISEAGGEVRHIPCASSHGVLAAERMLCAGPPVSLGFRDSAMRVRLAKLSRGRPLRTPFPSAGKAQMQQEGQEMCRFSHSAARIFTLVSTASDGAQSPRARSWRGCGHGRQRPS